MLHEEMSAADLAIEVLLVRKAVLVQVSGMVLAHVVLESLAVGVCRRLPSRLLCVRVEVIRQILAVGVPDLLIRWCENSDHVDRRLMKP